jgi:outer membrane immunogenic protein
MLRHTLFALVSSAALVTSANAADIYRVPEGVGGLKDPYVPAAIWTGFYVGVNGGYGWSGDDSKVSSTVTVPQVLVDPTANFSPAGGFGGGQLGYNWQRNHLVFGIEADLQGADISDTATATATAIGGSSIVSAKKSLDWFGTVRGRLGYVFDRTLVYATGGFAFGGVQDELAVTAVSPGATATKSVKKDDTATGFVVGGGVEHFVSPAWSVKGEYQYIDLGSQNLGAIATSNGVIATGAANLEHTYHTVRVGLNYHIHQEYEPLK